MLGIQNRLTLKCIALWESRPTPALYSVDPTYNYDTSIYTWVGNNVRDGETTIEARVRCGSMGATNLTIIELTMWPCVWQPTPKTADVTKIAGYVRVCILVNR